MRKNLQYIVLIICACLTFSCKPEEAVLRELCFQQTWVRLNEGDAPISLNVSIMPEEASGVLISWTSSNPEVATVSHEGVVTPISDGETEIMASAGDCSATCKVTVSAKKVDPSDNPGTDPDNPQTPVRVFGIKIDKTVLNIEEGHTGSVSATVSPENADNRSISYKSCNNDVATIGSDGTVTGVKEGQAVITATTGEGGFTAYCLVTVFHVAVHVTEIALSHSTLELDEGTAGALSATVSPENADNPKFIWSSSDSNIATVSDNGEVNAMKPGEAVIFATAMDGGAKDSCVVTVKHVAVPVTGLTMLDNDIVIYPGDVYSAVARIEPANADNRMIIWTVDDPSVADVSPEGIITAVAEGRTTLNAVSEEGGYEGTCSITVEAAPTGLRKVALAPDDVTLREGHTTHLEVVFTPSNATNRNYEIYSDNENVAAVSADGTVTARSVGNATISVKTADGALTASCHVSVIPEFIHVTDITLDKTSLSLIEGDTAHLSATVLPADADNPAVRFESSDSSVASVDSYGVVTAVSAGHATISAITVDGGLSATATVDVAAAEIPLEAISIDKTSLTIHYPDQVQLKAILTPSNATAGAIEWSCGNPEVVEVDNSGNITARGIGKAVVMASCGGFTAACTVTVENTVIQSVRIDSDTPVITVESGSTYHLNATVQPENASDKRITWSSSDPAIATVDGNGLVSFGRFGEDKVVTITATSVATPDALNRQAFSVKKGTPTLIINGEKEYFDYTTGNLANYFTGAPVYTLKFGKVALNAADIQAIKDKTRTSLSSIDMKEASFAVDGTSFIGYQINSNIHSVSITSPTEVPEYLFYEFIALTDAVLPDCTTKIGARVFCDSKLKSLVLPPNTVSIGQGAFASCPIESIIFNDGLKTVGDNLFSASSHVDNVEEILLPDSVTSIGSDSFCGMTKLKRFRFSPGISVGMNPLSGCTSLTTIEVAEGNNRLQIVDGCLVSATNVLFLTYPVGLSAGKTDITVGNGASKMTAYSCNYLQNTGCVTVVEGIEYMDSCMQFGSFTALDLPSTLLYIAHNAFMSTPVRSLKLRAVTPPTISGGSLMLPAVNEILVPAGSVEAYKTSTYWSKFASKIIGF